MYAYGNTRTQLIVWVGFSVGVCGGMALGLCYTLIIKYCMNLCMGEYAASNDKGFTLYINVSVNPKY